MSISSTINSSEAYDYVKQQYMDITRKLANKPDDLPVSVPGSVPNIKFEESEGIHVGNVIYNIHHHTPKTDFPESPRTSFSSSKFEVPKNFGKRLTKRTWVLLITLGVIVSATAVSLSVYYILRNDKKIDDGTTTSTTKPDNQTLIITRQEWGAGELNTTKIPMLSMPIKRIIIGQTRGQFCGNQNHCISIVKSLQTQDSTLDDIPYNFLIGGDGRIYEGRGIEYQGQHTENLDATEYNSIGICIAFIGNYDSTSPNSTQISLLTELIDYYKDKGLIADDYIIVLQDDLKYFLIKATKLNEEIAKLDNFRPLYKIYRREEWNAQRRKGTPDLFEIKPMNTIIIGHTVSSLCSSLEVCKASGRNLQTMNFKSNWSDILYNVYFGGDGFAFEGRGFDYWGAHHLGLNSKSIGVGVVGNFETVPPIDSILDAMIRVFDDAMALGKLSSDYKIFGRSDFKGPGPGTAFMNIIKGWCRYGNRTELC